MTLRQAAEHVRDRLESWSINARHTARLTIDPDQEIRTRTLADKCDELQRMLEHALSDDEKKSQKTLDGE